MRTGLNSTSSGISISVRQIIFLSIQCFLKPIQILDSSVSGSRFDISASPSLAHFSRAAAEEIPHPTDAGRTLWDATKDNGKLFGAREDGLIIMDEESAAVHLETTAVKSGLGVGTLGSGSDFTVFLQRIGVASGQGGFGSTLHDPVYHYHSVYDSEKWQETYGDPGFVRHVSVFLDLLKPKAEYLIIVPDRCCQTSGPNDFALSKRNYPSLQYHALLAGVAELP